MNRVFRDDVLTMVPGLRILSVSATTTTSGTISGTTATGYGMKMTKTASETGRYTLQLIGSDGNAQDAKGFVGVIVNLGGPDDAAMTDAKGIWQGVVRDIDIGAGAQDGTVEIQFQDADSGADTEVQDGALIYVTLLVRDMEGQTG